jgi:predicted kinase
MQAIIFVGIQGSGKSTFYKEHFFNSHIRVSLDLLNTRRKEQKLLDYCFATHSRFTVDNTNPTQQDRAVYIAQAKQAKYEVVGYYFSVGIQTALARNSLRSGKARIPEVGIKACAKKLERPSYAEGFDRLYFVDANQDHFDPKPWQDEI